MKVEVVYVINGTTETDEFVAATIRATIIPNGHGAAKVSLYDSLGTNIGWKLYAHCETVKEVK